MTVKASLMPCVALFPLSVSAFNELLVSLLYMLISTLEENKHLMLLSPMITDFSATLQQELK